MTFNSTRWIQLTRDIHNTSLDTHGNASFIRELTAVVGPDNLITDSAKLESFCRDWTGRWQGSALAAVLPGSTSEVSEVIQICAAYKVTVVPQGGNTGLVGGAVPYGREVVLSTSRLKFIGKPDLTAGQIIVGAGVTLSELNAVANASGVRYPIDFSSRDSATVGGSIATNAGGHHVLRFGMTRQQVCGIEAVRANGAIISHLRGLVKDNTGYDLAGLLCGSEGTLAVITAACLTLVPTASHHATALVSFMNIHSAVAAISSLSHNFVTIEAIEIMFGPGLETIAKNTGARLPIAVPDVALLIEAAGSSDQVDNLAGTLAALEGVTESAIATNDEQRRSLWFWRDQHPETILRLSTVPPHKLDVTIPIRLFSTFIPKLKDLIKDIAPEATLWLFGHGADGNLHINLSNLTSDSALIDEQILKLVASHNGSISAEHGIGRAKIKWLHLNRSEAELETFHAIKDAWDPKNLLNPNVLLPR